MLHSPPQNGRRASISASLASRPHFSLASPRPRNLAQRLANKLARPLEWLLSVNSVNRTYEQCVGAADVQTFLRRVIDDLGVRIRVAPGDGARIPKAGAVVVVSNHPFGAIDGIILASVLASARPDVKVLANRVLARI